MQMIKKSALALTTPANKGGKKKARRQSFTSFAAMDESFRSNDMKTPKDFYKGEMLKSVNEYQLPRFKTMINPNKKAPKKRTIDETDISMNGGVVKLEDDI